MHECEESSLAYGQLFHLLQFPCVLAPISVETYYVLPVSQGIDDNSTVVWSLSANYIAPQWPFD
jgi:hypothetical protein